MGVEKEQIDRREHKNISVPKVVAMNFVNLAKENGYSLHKIKYDVRRESKDGKGTKTTVTNPVELIPTENIDSVSLSLATADKSHQFLLQGPEHDYLLEVSVVDRSYIDSYYTYFVGITQVPSLARTEDLGKWQENVLEGMVRPSRMGESGNTNLPSFCIDIDDVNAIVKFKGEDRLLERFFKSF